MLRKFLKAYGFLIGGWAVIAGTWLLDTGEKGRGIAISFVAIMVVVATEGLVRNKCNVNRLMAVGFFNLALVLIMIKWIGMSSIVEQWVVGIIALVLPLMAYEIPSKGEQK